MEREELIKEIYLNYYPNHDDFNKRRRLLKNYRWTVSCVYSFRKRLKTGIVKQTGKPYSHTTLKGYKSELKDYENSMYKKKSAIKMLSTEGYFGNKKTPEPELKTVQGKL